MEAVVAVDQRVEDGFADRDERVFWDVAPVSCLRVDDGPHLHVAAAESESFFRHGGQRPFDPFIVDETGAPGVDVADARTGNDHSGDRQLREESLRIQAERHHGGQSESSATGDVQHFIGLRFGKLAEAGTFKTLL